MKKIILCIVVSFSILTGSKSFAQIYIVFDGVKGESNFAAFPASTEISSFQWGAENTVAIGSAATGGAGAGKVKMNELKLTKQRGSASSALQMFVFNGKRIPKAEIRFYKSGSSTQYLTIILEDVFISSWSISGDGGAPMESLSLNFVKFRTEDAIMGAGGKLEKGTPVGWDISRNIAY